MADFSQAALWAILDAAGVPFREPLQNLIDTYGLVPSGWSEGLTHCHLPGEIAGFPALADPLMVTVQDVSDRTLPAPQIIGYVRAHDDARQNYAFATRALAGHFGPGRDTSVSNTVAALWGGSYCNVTVLAFPAELQGWGGTNLRHDKVPGSRTECTITIRPDYWPAADAAKRAALQSYAPDGRLYVPAMGRFNWPPLPTGMSAPPGIGFTPELTHFVAISRDRRCVVIPRHRIVSLHHDVLTPAKGVGGSTVSLRYRISDLTDAPQQNVILRQGPHDAADHANIATSIAERIAVPFLASDFPDA